MRTPTALLISELFEDFKIYLTPELKQVTDNLNGTFTLRFCNTAHLRECSMVLFGATQYEVISINDKDAIVKGTSYPTGDPLFPEVYFYNGTPIMVGHELDSVLSADQKTPFLYLYEPITDKYFNLDLSIIERESNVVMYFLDQSNYQDWDTDQHYSGAVSPMFNLAGLFMEFLMQDTRVGEIEDYSITYIPNFSIVRNVGGTSRKIFNDDLSGVELKVSIPFYNNFDCCS